MTNILIYDTDAEELEKIAIANDISVAEIIDSLMGYIDQVKEGCDLK